MLNTVTLMGRLTSNPEIRKKAEGEELWIAKYCLAVQRDVCREGGQKADFIWCNAFGKKALFAERYLRKGNLIAVKGRLASGSYVNRDGYQVYTTELVVEKQYVTQYGTQEEAAPERGMTHTQAYGQAFPDTAYQDLEEDEYLGK